MNDGRTVRRMCEQVDAADALEIIGAIGATASAVIERKVYYPYFWFRADCGTRTLFGRHAFSASCLIDARSGLGATADAFDAEASTVAADAVLAARATPDEADRAARRFLTHSLGRKLRMLAGFDVKTKALGLVYKAFWLVRCDGLTLLVDSMTGSIHPLPATPR